MTEFQVKIEDSLGFHTQKIEGKDKFAVYRDLKKQGTHVITVDEIVPKKKALSFEFGRIGMHDKILFAKNTSAMLKAGLTLSRILSVMERQTKKKKLASVL